MMTKNSIKANGYEMSLKSAVVKEINGKRHDLLRVSWGDWNNSYNSFVKIIDYQFLQHCDLLEIGFSLSFLNNEFSKEIGRFFHIFHNEVFKTNKAVWRFRELEFSSFKNYLIYRIAAGFCAKNKKTLPKNLNHNSISAAEISKIILDTEAVKLITNLHPNKLELYSLFNPPSSFYQKEEWDGFFQWRVSQVKELFILLRESNEILLKYIPSTDPLFDYIPKKLAQSNDDELFKSFGVFEDNVRALVRFVLLRNQSNHFIHDHIAENSRVICFTERNGVFYKVVAVRNVNQNVVLNPIYPNGTIADYKSTDEPGFMDCAWLVKDVQEKLYFPDCSPKDVRRAAVVILDSYLKRDVIVHNHNTGKEENIDGATLYLCRDSFLAFVSTLPKKQSSKNQKRKRLAEFKDRLRVDIKKSPDKKLLPKISLNKNSDSYQKIGKINYELSARDVEDCWKEVVGILPKKHPWKKERRPRNNDKKS